MGVNSLPKTVTRQRRDCDLNPGPSAPESSTLATRLPSHPGYLLTKPQLYTRVVCLLSPTLPTTAGPIFHRRQADSVHGGFLNRFFSCDVASLLHVCCVLPMCRAKDVQGVSFAHTHRMSVKPQTITA